jgi:hypothetical protein
MDSCSEPFFIFKFEPGFEDGVALLVFLFLVLDAPLVQFYLCLLQGGEGLKPVHPFLVVELGVVLGDDGFIDSVFQDEAYVVGQATDILPADDYVGDLRTFVTHITLQVLGLVGEFDVGFGQLFIAVWHPAQSPDEGSLVRDG